MEEVSVEERRKEKKKKNKIYEKQYSNRQIDRYRVEIIDIEYW